MDGTEKRATIELRFNVLVPNGADEADEFVDRMCDAVVAALKESFRDQAFAHSITPDRVAVESFEVYGYTEEEVA